MLRFEKMKQCEEQSAWNYQEILDECLTEFDKDDEIVMLLGQLVREERIHEELAEELIKMCRHNHPEYGVFAP